jgi:hypothetical protein
MGPTMSFINSKKGLLFLTKIARWTVLITPFPVHIIKVRYFHLSKFPYYGIFPDLKCLK